MRVAVVGAGRWGENLVRNFYQLEALHAICDVSEVRLQQLSSTYPVVCTVQYIEEVLSDKRIEAVAIATPANTISQSGPVSPSLVPIRLVAGDTKAGSYAGIPAAVVDDVIVNINVNSLVVGRPQERFIEGRPPRPMAPTVERSNSPNSIIKDFKRLAALLYSTRAKWT